VQVRDHAVKRRREVHWTSRYAPRLPAEQQQQQQQQEAGTDGIDFDRLPTRPHAGTANIMAYNAKVDKLRENGYLRARMVRVRLLHYFICRLVGELSSCALRPLRLAPPPDKFFSSLQLQIYQNSGCCGTMHRRLLSHSAWLALTTYPRCFCSHGIACSMSTVGTCFDMRFSGFVCASGLGGHERSSVDLIRGNGRPNPALQSDAMRAEESDLSMALHSQIKELAELAGLRPQQAAAASGVCPSPLF